MIFVYLVGIIVSIFVYRNLQISYIHPKRQLLLKAVIDLKQQCKPCNVGTYGGYSLCQFHHQMLHDDNPLIRPPGVLYAGTWTIVGSAILWPITLPVVLTFHAADYSSTMITTLFQNFEAVILERKAAAMDRKTKADEQFNFVQRERERIALQKETFDVLDSLNN